MVTELTKLPQFIESQKEDQKLLVYISVVHHMNKIWKGNQLPQS